MTDEPDKAGKPKKPKSRSVGQVINRGEDTALRHALEIFSNDHPNDVDKSGEDIGKEMLCPSNPFRNEYVQSGLPLWLSIRRGQRVWTHASGSRRLEHARGLHPRRRP